MPRRATNTEGEDPEKVRGATRREKKESERYMKGERKDKSREEGYPEMICQGTGSVDKATETNTEQRNCVKSGKAARPN